MMHVHRIIDRTILCCFALNEGDPGRYAVTRRSRTVMIADRTACLLPGVKQNGFDQHSIYYDESRTVGAHLDVESTML